MVCSKEYQYLGSIVTKQMPKTCSTELPLFDHTSYIFILSRKQWRYATPFFSVFSKVLVKIDTGAK